MGLSIRAYARTRGCAESAVRKAIATRRISLGADGTIDPATANGEWERNTFAGRTLYNATYHPQRPSPSATGMPSPPAVSSDPVAAYLRARAVSETFKAKTAQFDYEERAGKVIQTAKVGEYATQWSSIVGDALAAFPDRVAPLVAAAKTESEIHQILAGETNVLRRKMAKSITDAAH